MSGCRVGSNLTRVANSFIELKLIYKDSIMVTIITNLGAVAVGLTLGTLPSTFVNPIALKIISGILMGVR